MGYRSDVVIAVDRKVLARNLLQKEIPECLGEPDVVNERAVYWVIKAWKWYDSIPGVRELEEWFDNLAEDEFGAMRIGEDDDDTQTWGEPYTFEIYLSRTITYPGNTEINR